MNAPTPVIVDRSKFIGGSDAAVVLGISPWRTPLDLYLDKVQPAKEDVTVDRHRARALNRGKRLEPYVLDMLASEHGIETVRRNERYIDSEHGFLACEIDAETADNTNVEVKTVHPFKVKDWGDENTDSIPVHYTAQAMHGLMVTGRGACIFAVLIGDDLRLYRVERDVETIAGMREREVAFWNDHVLAGVAPEATNAADVLNLFARDNGETVTATPEIEALIEELRYAKAAAKQADELADRLKLYIAGASNLIAPDGRALASWKAQSATRFDQRAFEEAHPDLFQQFKRTSDSRVLRIR